MKSLAAQLTLILTVVTASLLLAVWFVVYGPVVERLQHQDRIFMKDRLRTMRTLLQEEPSQPERLRSRVEKEWATRDFDRTYVRVFDPEGRLMVQSPALKNMPIFDHVSLSDVASGYLTRFEEFGMVLIGTRFSFSLFDGEKPYRVEIAFDRTAEALLFKTLREGLIGLTVFGFLICILGARFFASQALKPVRRISEMASSITSASLKDRVDAESLPIEFTELANTFNGMLNRLQDSFDRLSRFSADMAHELRTPVQNMMGNFGVALAQSRSQTEYVSALESGIEECERLKRIIDSLLFIARSKNPSQEIALQSMDLGEELTDVIGFYKASAEAAGINLELRIQPDLIIQAERTLLQRAVGNLLSNSIRYSDSGTTIVVRAESRGDRVLIVVEDQGCGIDADAISNIGERFFRADPSRSSASGGTGLGLSIVKVISQIHRGSFEVKSERGRGTSVQIDFALHSPSQLETRV